MHSGEYLSGDNDLDDGTEGGAGFGATKKSSKKTKKLGGSVAGQVGLAPETTTAVAAKPKETPNITLESLLKSLNEPKPPADKKLEQPVADGEASQPEQAADEVDLQAAAQEFIVPRADAARSAAETVGLDGPDSLEAAAAATHLALLRGMQERLHGQQPVAEALDAAQQATEDMIEQAAADASETAESDEGSDDVEMTTISPVNPNVAPVVPANTDQANQPPTPPTPPVPPTPAAAAGGFHGGNTPPAGPVNTPNVQPVVAASPNVIINQGNERGAFGLGLLVGAVGGYFGGRHVGRKQGRRGAEKQAAPVRKRLEQRLEQLQSVITGKERRIRLLTEENYNKQPAKQRPAFVEKIRQAAIPAEQVRSNVGRLLVEAPLVAAAVAAERPNRAPATKLEKAVVPFDKPAEQFSVPELQATAEKIVVAGVSLREMQQLGRLDEPGLRRVVGEFLKGGDVAKAVAAETGRRDVQYERDPKLRQQMRAAGRAGLQASTGGSGGILADGSDTTVDNSNPQAAITSPGQPALDAATVKAIRNRQAATVAVTTLLVVAAIVLVVLLT